MPRSARSDDDRMSERCPGSIVPAIAESGDAARKIGTIGFLKRVSEA